MIYALVPALFSRYDRIFRYCQAGAGAGDRVTGLAVFIIPTREVLLQLPQ